MGGSEHTPRIIGKGGAFSFIAFPLSLSRGYHQNGWIGSGQQGVPSDRVTGGPDYVRVRLGLGGWVLLFFFPKGGREGWHRAWEGNGLVRTVEGREARVEKTQRHISTLHGEQQSCFVMHIYNRTIK